METGGGGNSPRSQGSLVMLVGKAPRLASSWVRAPVQPLGTSGHHPHKKMEIFLRDVFDSPQRSPALTFSLCLRQGKCFHCKSEIRSRVVPDCLTQYLHNVYVLCDFSWWPSVAVAALSEVAASGEYPGKGIHLSGRLERTSIPHVVWLFGSPCCSWRTEKTSFCQVWSQAMPATAVWRMCNSLIAQERSCRVALTGPFSEVEATLWGARSLTNILVVLTFLKFVLHHKNSQTYTKVERIVYEPPDAYHSFAPYAS